MGARKRFFLLLFIGLIILSDTSFAGGNYDLIKLREGVMPYGQRAFSNGLIAVMYDGSISQNGNWAYLTEDGNVFSHKYASGFDYSEGLTPVVKEEWQEGEEILRLGYMNRQGEIVIEPSFDLYSYKGISYAGRFKDGQALVYQADLDENGKRLATGYWYRIDRKGRRLKEDEKIYIKRQDLEKNRDDRIYNDRESLNYDSQENIKLFGQKIDGVRFKNGQALVNIGDGENRGTYIVSKTKEDDKNLKARKSQQKIILDGNNIDFNAYLIKGNNYFKLRDLAYIFKGSQKEFDVAWNDNTKEIDIYPNKAYRPVGGEMEISKETILTPSRTKSDIYFEGNRVDIEAYKLKNNNYFKLRDLARLLDIGVEWDGENNTIIIDTSKGYFEE